MKKRIAARGYGFIPVLILLLVSVMSARAQGQLKNSGKHVGELVPSGWEHMEATGDLNKDGISDLIVSATPNNKAHMRVREDGYVYNFNQPIFGIYFGTRNGAYKCWKQYNHFMPALGSENELLDCSVSITRQGTISISVGRMYSAGGSDHSTDTYVFRYQNGGFFLIGKDEDSYSRMSGQREFVSYNYLTGKKQTVKNNVFDESVKPVEKWTQMKKSPLMRMEDMSL